MRTHTKHPSEILEVQYDFVAKLAERAGDVIEYIRTALSPGPEIVFVGEITPGIVTVQYAHGENGTAYDMGVVVVTTSGRHLTDFRRLRVRGVAVPFVETRGEEEVIEGGFADPIYNSATIEDGGGA